MQNLNLDKTPTPRQVRTIALVILRIVKLKRGHESKLKHFLVKMGHN